MSGIGFFDDETIFRLFFWNSALERKGFLKFSEVFHGL